MQQAFLKRFGKGGDLTQMALYFQQHFRLLNCYCFYYSEQTKGVVNTAVSAAVQAVRGRGRGALTRGAFVGAAAATGYITPGKAWH